MTTLYVSGPMTGFPKWNFPAFAKAAKNLRKAGYVVISPAENWGGATNVDRELCMRLDIQQVLTADGIALLDGWRDSRGARVEVDVAIEVGIDVRPVAAWLREVA